jgi:putative heme iron utilization protein
VRLFYHVDSEEIILALYITKVLCTYSDDSHKVYDMSFESWNHLQNIVLNSAVMVFLCTHCLSQTLSTVIFFITAYNFQMKKPVSHNLGTENVQIISLFNKQWLWLHLQFRGSKKISWTSPKSLDSWPSLAKIYKKTSSGNKNFTPAPCGSIIQSRKR